MWFDSWAEILRVLIIGTVSYAVLVALLSVSGKRTLGQLNAFDFIVTVAWASAHGSGARAAVTARPVALVVAGELQHAQLRKN